MPLAAPQEPHAEVFASSSTTRKKSRTESLWGSLQGKGLGSFLSLTDAVAVRIPLKHCTEWFRWHPEGTEGNDSRSVAT